MPSLPLSIVTILAPFAILFCKSKTWSKALTLLVGAIICRGGRTVCSVLRIMGLKGERAFQNYHRILNRAKWNSLQGSKTLLEMLIDPNKPILIGVDEHIERRNGKKIKAKGCYRDAVRSSKNFIVRCFGLKWISMVVIKRFSWSPRTFALPFLTALAPSERANKKIKKRHKTTIDWTIQMIKQVKRFLPNALLILVGDGGFANIELSWVCVKYNISLIVRMRLDARLFDFPEEKKGPGRKATKGRRLLTFKQMLSQTDLSWNSQEILWYGGIKKNVKFITNTCLWHVMGFIPIPIRFVLMVDPQNEYQPVALMSTNFRLAASVIMESFISRWSQEVTFREAREHLGVETQRQWSDLAIARTTPILFGLYSLVVFIADQLKLYNSTTSSSIWYQKTHVTFSDLLTEVKKLIWRERYFGNVCENNEPTEIPIAKMMDSMIDQLAATG
jgi:hypothetical protein